MTETGDCIIELWTPLHLAKVSATESSVDLPEVPELDPIRKRMKAPEDKLEKLDVEEKEKVAALEKTLEKSKAYHQLLAPLSKWVDSKAEKLDSYTPFTTDFDSVKAQESDAIDFSKDIKEHEPDFEQLQETATVLFSEADEAHPEFQDAKEELSTVLQKWDRVRKAGDDRVTVMEIVLDFNVKPFKNWLISKEDQVTAFDGVCLRPEILDEQMTEQKAVVAEFDERRPEYERLSARGKSLVATNDRWLEKEDFETQLKLVDEMWEDVGILVETRGDKLNDAKRKLNAFMTDYSSLIAWIEVAETKLKDFEETGATVDDVRKQLDDLETFRRDVADRQPTFEQTTAAGESLVETFADGNPEMVEENVRELQRRWDGLQASVDNAKDRLDDAANVAGKKSSLNDWVAEKLAQLDAMEKPAIEPSVVEKQLTELKDFQEDVDGHENEVEEIKTATQSLMNSSTPESAKELQDDLASLSEKWDALTSGSSKRKAALESNRAKAEKYEKAKGIFVPWLVDAERRFASLDEADVEPETLTKQQEETRAFNDEISKMKPELNDVIDAGNDLIDGRNPDDDEEAKRIRDEVDDSTTRYGELTRGVGERWDVLVSSLTSSSQFTSLYEVLVVYIAQGVAQTKSWPLVGLLPPVIEKQIEAFEDFEAEVAGKRREVDSILEKGKELMERKGASPSVGLQRKLADIRRQWDDLEESVGAYRVTLDETLEKAERFQAAYDDFESYLTEKEEALNAFGGIGVRVDDVKKQEEEIQVR